MKTITISTLLLVLAIATSSFIVSRQVSPKTTSEARNIESLRAHRQGKGVALTWTVNSSNAQSFNIERSYDGEYFDVIESIESNGASRYKYNDENIFPGLIYYRITTIGAGGLEENSAVATVRIVQKK